MEPTRLETLLGRNEVVTLRFGYSLRRNQPSGVVDVTLLSILSRPLSDSLMDILPFLRGKILAKTPFLELTLVLGFAETRQPFPLPRTDTVGASSSIRFVEIVLSLHVGPDAVERCNLAVCTVIEGTDLILVLIPTIVHIEVEHESAEQGNLLSRGGVNSDLQTSSERLISQANDISSPDTCQPR